ncbi:hypothetical protein SAMN05660909_02557 [Chitinophaga terrae (ex Kim and Jung 2007)]|uniref:DUF4270 family protein n=1 Tax=Chitinophaga terrae (ex Kim and Jung 2007) TaxID=408074 RepID=A0A1H4CD19_9BACT|nr:DUF4270 family protein [Chitinophaga terrae (ex Kim and Jung 2007)]MDQ0109399.1 hypothetical protein [Chitinophaga terrae (ex Kim and Jung 2007)]GEP88901.1 hypothetical protein CTE07_05460 [Chitinophaga terrae (ex Kim and Jung 2007)]SEA58266.1 hypothetical protein SAMN05660909_02557 [Chitinophaga terrae (ex Kim and Jung 2007)]
MKINFRNLSFLATYITLLFGAAGCNKSTILGGGLIPPGDLVNAQDTIITDIVTNNILRYDSSILNGQNAYKKILGSINTDPVFGKTHAFVFMQVSLPSSNFTFEGSGQVLDSVVLSLSYSGYTGDSATPQTFRVYRMNEPDFKIDSNYAYNRVLGYNKAELLGTATVSPISLRDSVSIYGKKEAAQLRIKLSNAFGNELLQQTTAGAFANDSAFRAYLKGFAIIPDTLLGSNSNMVYLDMNSVNTKLSVFYKNSTTDSLIATMSFNQYASAHANYFTRNYNGSQAARFINSNNANGDSLLFLNAAPGLFANIKIPNLENFPNVLINKAELVITEVTNGPADRNDIFIPPTSLSLRQYTNGDTTKIPIDYYASGGASFFGGTRQVVTNFGGVMVSQYTFNLANTVQRFIKKLDPNNGFRLEGYSPLYMDVNRVKAGGSKLSQYNIKLRIIYTKP